MGRQTRAKYRRWRRAEEEARRSKQAWRVASLCLVVIAAFAAYVFYDCLYSDPAEKQPPPPEAPRPVTLYTPPEALPPTAPVQEQSSSGEERPNIPKARAKSRRIAIDRYWEHEQPNVSPTEVSQPPVPNPGPATVLAPPAPPAPPAPIRASAPMKVPKARRTVTRVTQEKQKKKKKKIVVRQSPVKPKKPVVIHVPPGPAGTSTLHEVEATPVDD